MLGTQRGVVYSGISLQFLEAGGFFDKPVKVHPRSARTAPLRTITVVSRVVMNTGL